MVKCVNRHEGHHSEVSWEGWKGRQGRVVFLLDIPIGIVFATLSIVIFLFIPFVSVFAFVVVATMIIVLLITF